MQTSYVSIFPSPLYDPGEGWSKRAVLAILHAVVGVCDKFMGKRVMHRLDAPRSSPSGC